METEQGMAVLSVRSPSDATGDTMGKVFRRVFDASRCRERLVYWAEQRFGQTILRQRLQNERTSKKDDRLIGIYPGKLDLALIRLAIAAANAGKLLTGVRWEIYADFACCERLEYGRFDHLDLLGDVAPDRLTMIANAGQITLPSSLDAWDFDGLLLTHRCSRCSKVCQREVLVFDPAFQQCEHCGFRVTSEPESRQTMLTQSSIVAQCLMKKLMYDRSDRLLAEDRIACESVELMLDVHATPLFTWIFEHVLHGQNWSIHAMERGPWEWGLIELCYQRSLFRLLQNPQIHQAFCEFMRASYRRRLEAFQLNHEMKPLKGVTPEQEFEARLNMIRQNQEEFELHMLAIRELEDIVVIRPMDRNPKNAKVASPACKAAVEAFPNYLEYALVEIDTRLRQQS